MFKGIFTALITPFKSGEVDYQAYEKMVRWQIESGVHGLVVAGTTGEGSSLSKEEFSKLVETAVKTAKGKVAIIANTGVNSTSGSIELTKRAQELKANGVMLISPYYVKPTQEGIYQHFKEVHDASDLPIMLYNNPGRTGVDINNSTLARLSKLPRINALKECSGNPIRCTELKLLVENDFRILAGDDVLSLPYYSQGADGLVSTAGNVVPSLMVKLYDLWNNGEIKEAMELQSILLPLNQILFCESNPIPVKYAASQFGICTGDLRLPLIGPSEENRKLIRETLENLKIRLNEYSN